MYARIIDTEGTVAMVISTTNLYLVCFLEFHYLLTPLRRTSTGRIALSDRSVLMLSIPILVYIELLRLGYPGMRG